MHPPHMMKYVLVCGVGKDGEVERGTGAKNRGARNGECHDGVLW